jgi:D-xylulose kinase
MPYLLGVDIGTTGAKAVLFESNGATVTSAFVPWALSLPGPTWAEQDPSEWWLGTTAAVREVMERSGVSPTSVVGLGLAGQMHGLVLLGARREVLRPSIIWCDQRSDRECDWIVDRVGRDRLVSLISNGVSPAFTASKLLWVRAHEPDVWARARTMLLPKDYVRLRLTDGLATDVSDAAGTALFDVAHLRWSDEMLSLLEISTDLMPEVHGSAEVVGYVTASAAALTGLPPGLPVVAGGADNSCAAVGNGAIEPGQVLVSIGSSGIVLAPSAVPTLDPQSRIHTFNHSVPERWYLMGVTQGAGLSLRWFRDEFAASEAQLASAQGRDTYDVMTAEAAESPLGSKGLFWLPYLQGERTPHLDPAARGVLFGLTSAHRRGDVFRAVMEGVAFSLRDCLDIIAATGTSPQQVTFTGGGARSPLWREILAAVLGLPVATTSTHEGPALGAALLAAVGTGVYSSVREACMATVRQGAGIEASSDSVARYNERYALYRSLYPALRPLFADAAALERSGGPAV